MDTGLYLPTTPAEKSEFKNPAGILILACALAISALAAIGWSIYDSHIVSKDQGKRSAEVERSRTRIQFLNEALTLSTQMAIATGDAQWQTRHQELKPKIDRVFADALRLAPGRYCKSSLELAITANQAILKIEQEAIALALNGHKMESEELLTRHSYTGNKELYALGISSFYMSRNTESQLARLTGAIKFLDEALTMSCRLAAASGSLTWKDRYDSLVTSLDEALKECLEIEAQHSQSEGSSLSLTDDANQALIAMETEAFQLVQDGSPLEASKILNSTSYALQKREYAVGMHAFRSDLAKVSLADARAEDNKSYYMLLGVLAVLLVTCGGWAITIRTFGKWHGHMARSNQDLCEQGKHLEELNEDLDRRVAEQTLSLREAVSAAEAANQAKSEFLANMSHELRTPLGAILGFAENMLDPKQNARDRLDCVQTINRNGEHLLKIISDILDLSKIEAGKMTIEKQICSPCQILVGLVELMEVRFESKGLELLLEFKGDIPCEVTTDGLRLRQVLVNIVGNAVKFTEVGSVKITSSYVAAGKNSMMQFEISDTGCGLSEDQVNKLFSPFVQADTSTTRTHGGTGLGLTISRRFAELLGGDVHIVSSKPNVGTTFCVTVAVESKEDLSFLPSPQQELEKAKKSRFAVKNSNTSLLGYRLLLAEDGPDNQRLISFVMRKAGADVEIVENGKLALARGIDAICQGTPYDVILMDMQMPVMGGYEATRLLRKAGYSAPIIAITANAMSGDDNRCLDVGCDGYASKPIQRASVIAKIVECASRYRVHQEEVDGPS